MLGGRTKQREGLEEITEEEGMDVVAKVSAAGYQPRARVRTWQQDAPPISRDMIGGTVAFCFDMTPTSKTVTPQYVEGQVEDVSDGKSRYLPKGGKTDKGGREYGPRWCMWFSIKMDMKTLICGSTSEGGASTTPRSRSQVHGSSVRSFIQR